MIGGLENDVRRLAADEDVDIANINAPNQIVISGEMANVEIAVGAAKQVSGDADRGDQRRIPQPRLGRRVDCRRILPKGKLFDPSLTSQGGRVAPCATGAEDSEARLEPDVDPHR